MESARASRRVSPAAALSESDVEDLRRVLEPPASEPWREIPWEISLVQASRTATRVDRPMLVVVWSGHPLGCT
jgi:hypothetical protein